MINACRSDDGFSLIEFLVALVILMVGLLGLLQCVNLAYSTNLQNDLRNVAVVLADEEMSKELKKGYGNVIANNTLRSYTTSRPILSAMKNYSVSLEGKQVSTGSSESRQINVLVAWRHKKMRYEHGLSAVVTQQN